MRPLRVTCGVTTSANLLIPKVNHRIRYPVPRRSPAMPGQSADIGPQTFAPLSVPICLFALTATRPPRHHLGTTAAHLGTLPPTCRPPQSHHGERRPANACRSAATARPASDTGNPTGPPIEAHTRARKASYRPSENSCHRGIDSHPGIDLIYTRRQQHGGSGKGGDRRATDGSTAPRAYPASTRTSPKGP